MRTLLAVTVAAIVLAGPAHAEPVDNQAFLAALDNAGITYTSPDQAVTAAQTVCQLAAKGESGLQVLTDLKAANPGFTTDAAAQFATIAAATYCPQQLTPSVK